MLYSLTFFSLFNKYTYFKYKLNVSVFFLHHLSSATRFLCWYQKLFFQLFQNSDSLLPLFFFSPPEWNAIETKALILLILKHVLNINISCFHGSLLYLLKLLKLLSVVLEVPLFSMTQWVFTLKGWKVKD